MKKVFPLVVLLILVFAGEAFAWGWTWYKYSRCYSVPEPSTLILLGSGLAGLVAFGRGKFKK